MRKFVKGILRLLASYAAIVIVMMLMPIFLITNDVSMLDSLKDFVF